MIETISAPKPAAIRVGSIAFQAIEDGAPTLSAPAVRSPKSWIRTFTGQKFWPLDPRPTEVFIEDIAHALSLICRFTGHVRAFYSVAEHSLRVSELAEAEVLKSGQSDGHLRMAREIALWGLLHDASEAYLLDLASPVKRAQGIGPIYRQYESRLMCAVIDRFNLFPHEPSIVKEADTTLLNTEMRDLMNGCADRFPRLQKKIEPCASSVVIERRFLRRFEALNRARKADGRCAS